MISAVKEKKSVRRLIGVPASLKSLRFSQASVILFSRNGSMAMMLRLEKYGPSALRRILCKSASAVLNVESGIPNWCWWGAYLFDLMLEEKCVSM